MTDKKVKIQSKTKQFILFGFCSVMALIIAMVTLVIVVKNIDDDVIIHSETSSEDYSELLNDKKVQIKYIENLTAKAVNNKFVKVNTYTDISIENEDVLQDGVSLLADRELFSYLKGQLCEKADSLYEDDYVGKFGTPSSVVNLIDLSDVELVSCKASVGLVDENGEPVYDDEKNIVDGDFLFFKFTADGNSISTQKGVEAYNLKNSPDIIEDLQTELSSVCRFNSLEVEKGDFTINVKASVKANEISNIEIQRIYSIKADVEFIGVLSQFGKKTIEFQYKVTEKFDYFYAGVSLSQNALSIEKGEETALGVNAVIEDNSDYKVVFKSSDASVATVDEMGYVKCLEEEPVTITVHLEYLGETFTDSCIINGNSLPENDGEVSL